MASGDDDAFWQRPANADPSVSLDPGPSAGSPARAASTAPYLGPPASTPPPFGWRPPTVVRPADPRVLPGQDHARIDIEEQAAQTLTKGIGMLAGALMLVMLFILCGRVVF